MRWISVVVLLLLLPAGAAAAEKRERGFVDLYLGVTRLFESDVSSEQDHTIPGWDFDDTAPVGGVRVGVWFHENWALTFRTWYQQTDAKEERSSPSDLGYLGLALEVLARWPFTERWAVYGTLGPMLAVTTLDLVGDDDRSVAPGASSAVGLEFTFLRYLRGFAEAQFSLVYPEFDLGGRHITPRLFNTYGVLGVRVPF
jgi:hypothetical protein